MRPDADWCSLCFAVLRAPAPAPEPVDAGGYELAAPFPGVQPRHAAPDPLTAPLLDVVLPELALAAPAPVVPAAVAPEVADGREPRWPCTACGTSNPFSASACSVCGSGFLASASTTPKLVLPVVGDVGAMSRSQRLLAALGVLVAVLAPVALVTFLLTGSPPAGGSATPDVARISTP